MMGQQLGWAAAEHAWVFAVIVLVAGLSLYQFYWRGKVLERLGDLPMIRRMTANTSRLAQWTKWALTLMALLFLGTALLRPQYGTREAEIKNRGIDVAIVLDMSKSMLVRDVAPNRLKAAVVELHDILDNLSGGRAALVPFAGTAFTQTALTTDLDAVREYLDALRVEDMPLGGTRVGVALMHAIELFTTDDDDEDDPSFEGLAQPDSSHFKAIILVTDGDNHDEEAVAAAELAANNNIRIYTVGIGSQNSSARIPQVSDEGEQVGWAADKENKPIFSDLNVALLDQISAATDGLSVVYGRDDVAGSLMQALDGLEKREYEHHYENLREDRFQLLLIPAFILLLMESLLSDRRWRRRREVGV